MRTKKNRKLQNFDDDDYFYDYDEGNEGYFIEIKIDLPEKDLDKIPKSVFDALNRDIQSFYNERILPKLLAPIFNKKMKKMYPKLFS